jgi:hypothetical protein
LRTFRLGKYFSASSLSVALMRSSICSPVMPSMVVGICVGKEVGRPPLMTTVSSFFGAWSASAQAGRAASSKPAACRRRGFVWVMPAP